MSQPPIERAALPRALAAALAAIFILTTGVRAQQTGTLEGRVTAAESSAPIAGATVTIPGTVLGTITGEDGAFRIEGLVPGEYRIHVVSVGRQAAVRTVQLRAGATTRAEFPLAVGSVLVPGIVVSATRTPEVAERVATTTHVMTRERIRTSPARAAARASTATTRWAA